MKRIFALLLLSFLSYGQVKLDNKGSLSARGKEGGNGQLVVIPRGHKKPVPYEAVRALETGRYRNFYRLPCVNGNIEKRENFNRDYACHAMKWLDLVKGVSKPLYKKLIKAARTTHFRIVNDYIQWEHVPYPEGEIAYKKYEKAAFYNGEIILSTPVMDRVGPLDKVLTKEQNQGYIVFHELINAAFPERPVVWKLNLGEVFIQKIVFHHSKRESLINLGLLDISLVKGIQDKRQLLEVLKELVLFEKNSYKKSEIENMIFVLEEIMFSSKKYGDVYKEYLEKQSITSIYDLAYSHKKFLEMTHKTGLLNIDLKSVFTEEMYRYLMKTYKMSFSDLRLLKTHYLPNIYEGLENLRYELTMSSLKEVFAKIEVKFSGKLFTAANMITRYYRDFFQTEHEGKLGTKLIGADLLFSYSNYDLQEWILENALDEYHSMVENLIQKFAEKQGIDLEKTKKLMRWSLYPEKLPCPLIRNDKLGKIVDTMTQEEIWDGRFKKVKKDRDGTLRIKLRMSRYTIDYDVKMDRFIVYKGKK